MGGVQVLKYMEIKKEIWKSVVGYEGLYKISNLGNGISIKRHGTNGGFLKKYTHKKGYIVYVLTKNSHKKSFFAHRLVATAFIKNSLQKKEINHIDGNKKNNNVRNLEWVSRLENMQHAKNNGLIPLPKNCQDHPNSKLNNKQVFTIKKLLLENKLNQRQIADLFCVNKSVISLIHTKKSWVKLA